MLNMFINQELSQVDDKKLYCFFVSSFGKIMVDNSKHSIELFGNDSPSDLRIAASIINADFYGWAIDLIFKTSKKRG